MSSPAPFKPIARLLERGLSIRHVYGKPVRHGDTTVIPIAQVACGFGGGGGRGPGRARKNGAEEGAVGEDSSPEPEGEVGNPDAEGEGEGGGGGFWMRPVGALEIGPEGTRFVHFHPRGPLVGAAVLGLAIGWLFGRRRGAINAH